MNLNFQGLLQSTCSVLGFEVGEIWFARNQPGTKKVLLRFHQLHISSIYEEDRRALIQPNGFEAYSDESDHKASPFMCRRAFENGKIVWANAKVCEGLVGRDVPLHTAVGIPVCTIGDDLCVIVLFSVGVVQMTPRAIQYLCATKAALPYYDKLTNIYGSNSNNTLILQEYNPTQDLQKLDTIPSVPSWVNLAFQDMNELVTCSDGSVNGLHSSWSYLRLSNLWNPTNENGTTIVDGKLSYTELKERFHELMIGLLHLTNFEITELWLVEDTQDEQNNNNNNNNNKIPHITSFTRKTKDINGCIYHGEYKGYDRHGNGQLLYPNGDIFEGIFKKNVIHGKGKYTYGNGDVFIGKWKNGYRHGKGVYTVSDGEIIDEMYQNGHKIKGKFIFPNYIYIGSFDRDGKKQGHGIIRYTCGEVYEGGFVNDHREGNGKFIYSNGDIYEGNFHENFRHGKGKYIGHKGDVFTGEYKYDKKDCENGTYITITGDVLNGTWKNNIKHGKFKIKYTNGDTYVGDYKYDKKHGRGTYTYSNTESYTGEYRNGMKHGQGTYRFKNGQEKRGLWYDDILTENSLSGGSSSHGITRGISMKSVLSEQNEKEQKESDNYNNNKNHNNSNKDFDDNDTIISNLSKSYRELFHDPSNHLNKGITKNTNSSISPYRQSSPNINRNRSGSDGSERSVTVIARQSPLRSSNGKQQTRERYTSPKLSQIRN